jgi:hypothetical protein
MELFETFSDYIKDKIRAAQEWKVGTQDGDISPEGKVIVNEDGGEPIPMDSVPF